MKLRIQEYLDGTCECQEWIEAQNRWQTFERCHDIDTAKKRIEEKVARTYVKSTHLYDIPEDE